jgi:hypothetical protein
MPFDPISAGTAAAGMILDFLKSQQARQDAKQNQQFQMQNLYDALGNANAGRAQSLGTAGALRTDQFGNATYYDPQQGRWVTSYSPTQQRLIDQGQERQGRANVRGAQASSDYDRLRGEYLYQKPKSEAESYAEIIDLINQAQGTGERQLNTLMNRWGVRTAGNLPQLSQLDTGPSAGQQLAETMLKARSSALDESLKRQAGHTSQYLPALKQFEDTANYMAPVDQTGSSIVGLESQGRQQQLSAMSDYDKLISTIYGRGGGDVNNAASLTGKADLSGPGASDFLKFAQMLMPEKAGKTGTTGNTTGATYSSDSDGNSSGSTIGNWDRRFNYGPQYNLSGKGTGSEAAAFGGEPGTMQSNPNYISPGADPYGDVSSIINNRFGNWQL